MRTLLERFEEKYIPEPNSGCWLWIANINQDGYGKIRNTDGTSIKAHRAAWELYKGPIPEHNSFHGMCVCHTCDNPCCVNPDHLFLATHQENVRDMVKKGRAAKIGLTGEANHNSKLTNPEILAIRSDKRSQYKIAGDYGVSQGLISMIKSRKSWGTI